MAVGMGRDTRRQRDVGGSRARGPPPARSRSRSCPGSWARSWRPLAACSPAWPARRGCSSRPSTSAQAHTPRHHLALRAITPHSARAAAGRGRTRKATSSSSMAGNALALKTDRVPIVPLRVSNRAIQNMAPGRLRAALALVALVLLPSFGAAQSTKYKKGDAVPLFANKVRPRRGDASDGDSMPGPPPACRARQGLQTARGGGRGSGYQRQSGLRLAGWCSSIAGLGRLRSPQPARAEAQAGAALARHERPRLRHRLLTLYGRPGIAAL